MSPDENKQPGQEPGQEPQTPQAGGRDYEAEIADLRKENAKRRTQLRDAQKKVKEYEPIAAKYSELEEANKGEAEKLADKLATLQAQVAAAQATAAHERSERKLTVLATKAGVSADMLQYLDVSKFDLEDEEATITALSALAPAKGANSGGSSNPARNNTGMGDDELKEWYTGRGQTNYMFGDK